MEFAIRILEKHRNAYRTAMAFLPQSGFTDRLQQLDAAIAKLKAE